MAIVKEIKVKGKTYLVPEIPRKAFEFTEDFSGILNNYLCCSAKCSLVQCGKCILSSGNKEAFQELLEKNFPEEVILDRITPPVHSEVKIKGETFLTKRVGKEECKDCDLLYDTKGTCQKLHCISRFRPDNQNVIFTKVD